jgi:hypothetical protein
VPGWCADAGPRSSRSRGVVPATRLGVDHTDRVTGLRDERGGQCLVRAQRRAQHDPEPARVHDVVLVGHEPAERADVARPAAGRQRLRQEVAELRALCAGRLRRHPLITVQLDRAADARPQ